MVVSGGSENEPRKEGGSSPPDPDTQGEWKTDTVEELVEEAKYHAQFEEARINATNQRAAWLLALNGVILGLVANEAREMLTQSKLLGQCGRLLAAGSLIVGVSFVLISAYFALKVIFKAKSWQWDLGEIEKLTSNEFMVREKVDTQGTFLDGLTKRVKAEREGYGDLRRWLNAAFGTLGVALAAVALHVGVYSVRTIQNPCPGTSAVRIVKDANERTSAGRRTPALRFADIEQGVESATPSKWAREVRPASGGACSR